MQDRHKSPSPFDSSISIGAVTAAHLRESAHAFTRIELLAVAASLLVIALVVAPAAMTTKSDSERLVCFNNLRLIGRSVQMWAGDHNQQFPWRTPVAEGGGFTGTSRPGNAWVEHFFLSNELVTPKILACPSDVGVLRAKRWHEFASASFRANALSYSLATDGSTDAPRDWLSADRNLRPDQAGVACSAGFNNVHGIITGFSPSSSVVAWTNGAVHGTFGHVLTTDGAVEFTSTPRLKELVFRRDLDNGTMHFLKAR